MFFASCGDRDLGDGYFHLPKYEAIDVGYPENESILYRSSEEYLFSDIIIKGDVIEVQSDSRHIIAKRDPLIKRDNNTGTIEYFIIQKVNDSLIGPLTKKVFKESTNDLNVNLEFK